MKKAYITIGAILVLASVTILASQNFTTQKVHPPVLSSENSQSTPVNYTVFFGLALGGGGFLILLFSFLQWYGKRRST